MTLIVRLPNWIGDVMMALPTLFALQEQGVELHLYGREWVEGLLAHLFPHVYTLPSSIWAAARCYRKNPVKQALIFPYSFSSALALRLAGKQAVGFQGDGRSWMLKGAIPFDRRIHYVPRYFNLVSLVQKVYFPATTIHAVLPKRLTMPVDSHALAQAKSLLSQHKINENFWMLAPGATGLIEGESKVWPLWAALTDALVLRGIPLLACTTDGERSDVQRCLPGVTLLVDLPLSVFVALLSLSKQVIANDSGAMHLATAVNAPILGVFGRTHVGLTGPWGGQVVGAYGQWPSVADVLKKVELL